MSGFLTLFCLCLAWSAHGRRRHWRFLEPSPLPRFPSALQWPIVPADLGDASRGDVYGLAWERSGLFEGDIVTSPGDLKNILTNPAKRWPMPVPVFINGTDFEVTELGVIERALSEIEEMTCVRFRQYQASDASYIVVRGNAQGCWSMVGRRDGGQVVHLQRPACVHHGIVVHEFLHALGLHHQQSSPDRDDFVKIHWENIKQGREYNFNKYSRSDVTTYNLTYDYSSVMHYSEKAFSFNGNPTITPLDANAAIGQRRGMSELDAVKVRLLYDCPATPQPIKKPSPDTDEDLDYDYGSIFE